jgi:hypothetical protein
MKQNFNESPNERSIYFYFNLGVRLPLNVSTGLFSIPVKPTKYPLNRTQTSVKGQQLVCGSKNGPTDGKWTWRLARHLGPDAPRQNSAQYDVYQNCSTATTTWCKPEQPKLSRIYHIKDWMIRSSKSNTAKSRLLLSEYQGSYQGLNRPGRLAKNSPPGHELK